MKVYFISGLAADRRVFKNIQLPIEHEAIFLDWIQPLPHESLREYSHRMAEKIDRSEKFAIVGLSMGGMMAVEISNQLSPSRTILISSIPTSSHLPGYYKLGGKLHIHRIIPIAFLKNASVIKRFFTTETESDKQLLKEVIRESDPIFIRWAMEAIVNWKNDQVPPNLIHIHGTKDFLLPMRYTKPTHVIQKAGHMMVMTKGEEISRCLAEVLGTI